MNRDELKSRWEGYCRAYVPERPTGFSEDGYVFEAKDVSIPSELSRQMTPEDKLTELTFHDHSPERGLGATERSPQVLAELTEYLRKDCTHMAFGYEFAKGEDIHVVRDARSFKDRDVWFVGDIHGDILALRSVLAFIASHSERRPIHVFLGDLFDRHPFGLNVVMEVVQLLRRDPDSVFLLPGNHDDGLEWTGTGFTSRITPHQFAEELNAFGDDTVSAFVREYIRLVKRLPVGLLLPNGTFIAHAGVPSRPERSVKNIWENLSEKEIKQLIRDQRSQFLCNRFQKDAKTKIAPDFGWMELVNFSEAMEKAYGVPVRSMVRGHDHCDLCRHDWARSDFDGSEYCSPEKAGRVRDVLTMTTMVMLYEESRLPGFLQREVSFPTVARYRQDVVTPELHVMCLNDNEVKTYVGAAEKPIALEHARIVAGRRGGLEEQREMIRKDQEAVGEKLKRENLLKENFATAVKKSQDSMDAWGRKVDALLSKEPSDTDEIVKLKEKVEEVSHKLEELRRKNKATAHSMPPEQETRWDDFKAGVKGLFAKSEGDLVREIDDLQKEIQRRRDELRESNPELLNARNMRADAMKALTINKEALADKDAVILGLQKEQSRLLEQANNIQREIEQCRDAESLLKKGGK